jgi:hypothetical protein
MRSLGLTSTTPLPLPSVPPSGFPTHLAAYLTLLKTQSYLTLHKVDVLPDSGMSGNEFAWGPRAFIEIGERAVGEFMLEIEKEVNEKLGEMGEQERSNWEKEWLDDLSRAAGYKDASGLKDRKGYKGVSVRE